MGILQSWRRGLSRALAEISGQIDPDVRRTVEPFFDERYYLSSYPDVALTGIDPLVHFLTRGWRAGQNPNNDFETVYYLDTNPDVAAAHINPYFHYLTHGMDEGRLPHRPRVVTTQAK
jgi:hypothetical protein